MITTLQDMFDRAYIGLRSQGFQQSVRRIKSAKTSGCLYRGPEGRRCAIGWLIPDVQYTPVIEGVTGWKVLRNLGICNDHILLNAADELQDIHDIDGPVDMGTRLRQFAAARGLTVPT